MFPAAHNALYLPPDNLPIAFGLLDDRLVYRGLLALNLHSGCRPSVMGLAAQRAEGVGLLFADAAVVFRPVCRGRGAAYAEAPPVDHLVLVPDMETCAFGERMMVVQFGTFMVLGYRPGKVAD